MQCSSIQCNAMQCNAKQRNSRQYSAMQCHAVEFGQLRTLQYSDRCKSACGPRASIMSVYMYICTCIQICVYVHTYVCRCVVCIRCHFMLNHLSSPQLCHLPFLGGLLSTLAKSTNSDKLRTHELQYSSSWELSIRRGLLRASVRQIELVW